MKVKYTMEGMTIKISADYIQKIEKTVSVLAETEEDAYNQVEKLHPIPRNLEEASNNDWDILTPELDSVTTETLEVDKPNIADIKFDDFMSKEIGNITYKGKIINPKLFWVWRDSIVYVMGRECMVVYGFSELTEALNYVLKNINYLKSLK
jgi:hypothetical protein